MKLAILAALNTTHWNRKRAATVLRIDYKALLYKMKKLGIQAEPRPRGPLAAANGADSGVPDAIA